MRRRLLVRLSLLSLAFVLLLGAALSRPSQPADLSDAAPARTVIGGSGYWLVASDGGIFSFGDAAFFGSTGDLRLNRPIVGMAATPTGLGYWLVASDGGVFSFGDATFFGSTGSIALNKPIVSMSSTPTGRGYWLVASDGGIFSFGDATFYGSTGAITLNRPIVSMATTPSGGGYWLVASDGGVFTFGDAAFAGSPAGATPTSPVVGLAPTPGGLGYWMSTTAGQVFAFGDAPPLGSIGVPLTLPIRDLAPTATGLGYWLVGLDGGIFTFGDAPFLGSTGGTPLNQSIVGMAATPRIIRNAVPVAVNDTATTAEDTPVTVNILVNDSGLGDAPVSVSIATPPSSGTASATASGSILFTPAANATGPVTLTYRVTDVDGDSATATVTIVITAVNDAPTISDVANRTIAEDSTTGAVAFTVGDIEAPAGGLTVTGSSSNAALVPNANIAFSGSGANRAVTVTPLANQSGTATISLTVDDGAGGSATDAFVLTVTPVNDAPTIGNVTDQTINEDTNTGALAFAVGDTETAAASLTMSGTSSNTALVPNANIVFGGSAGNRTVTATPLANQFGAATITITVSDADGGSSSDTFVLNVASVNDAPTITDVADQSINEDSNTGALAFTVGDVETAAGSLTMTGSSANTALVPNGSVVFGGSGASRTVTVTPLANQSGSSTITITVTDANSGTATDTFVLTVNAVNDAPTISDAADQTINEDANTGALAFTVGDAETAPGSLTMTGSSSNTALVPNGNIVFGGSGASRTVTATPAANQFGTATITLTVSDGSASTSDTFALTVTSVNDAPTITNVADQTINEDSNTGALTFTVGDVETAAASLTMTGSSSNTALVPNGSIVFGGSGASRTVTVTPLANQSGSSTITITVTDANTGTATDTFVLTVTAVNDNPTITDVADQTINEDANTGALAFTVGDVESPGTLTMTGSSSNTALVPNGNIVFGGSGASRTVTVTPLANQSGSSTITITVTDANTGTASDAFLLTVTAVNDPPTITDIGDQSISANGATGDLPFTIGDVETDAAGLTVTGSSSNTTLVPNTSTNISFGGSETNRTVKITPAAGESGSVTITVTVSDGSLSASDTFLVTVTP